MEWVHLLCGKGVRFLNNSISVTQLFGKREGAGIKEGENDKITVTKGASFYWVVHNAMVLIITLSTLSFFHG